MIDDYETVLDDTPLRQGDVIEWVLGRPDEKYHDPQKKFAIVVTADCDLEQRKTGGKISYIPALVAEDFIWSTWRPRKFEKARNENLEKLSQRLSKFRRKSNADLESLSSEAVASWVQRCGVDVLTEIGVTDPGQRKDLSKLVEVEVQLSGILSAKHPDIDNLVRCNQLLVKNPKGCPKDALGEELKGVISNLPGDVFYVSSSHEKAPGGMFCLLRSINQCDEKEISIRPDEIRRGQATGKRIGNLKSPYRFAMIQNLAKVFTDIGLPDEYHDRMKKSSFMLISDRVEN